HQLVFAAGGDHLRLLEDLPERLQPEHLLLLRAHAHSSGPPGFIGEFIRRAVLEADDQDCEKDREQAEGASFHVLTSQSEYLRCWLRSGMRLATDRAHDGSRCANWF